MKFLQSFPVILAVFSFAANLVSSKLVYEYETKYVTVEIVTIVSGRLLIPQNDSKLMALQVQQQP